MKNIFKLNIDIPLVSVNNKYVNRQYALTREYSNFLSALTLIARLRYNGATPSEKNISISMRVSTRKDIDNVIKPIIDAMQEIVFVNDSQVQHIDIKRFDAGNKIERLEIKINEVE